MRNIHSNSKGFQFNTLSDLSKSLGATRTIRRLLVANNGLASVKGIDSIRSWLYEHTGDPEAIQFVVMATPEDLKANAEFISMADQHVKVPGGPNDNNYANIDLIMHTALQNTCDGIYPGWGHASENPALPRECGKSKRVTFLGPSEDAMFALGDKIASTIVAQSNGVPTVPWSGDCIRLPPGVFDVDAVTYDKAYVTTPEECEKVCRRIGFPVMIKASEGGGGKGIRRCTSIEEVKDMFFAVSEEVKGCHIFVMRMLTNVRHLEVQLLADDYGDCIAVRTRDCSVQRRHQKIIEEGPAFGVSMETITAMEHAAIQLAKAVNYRGLGTVEYMYDKGTRQFYFLELNPRIQVEHPVSELISGVNLPAALLCVGMGIPLHRIPEVRVFFGENPYDTSPINFAVQQSIPAKCHTIAVRVTAEDTDEGFRPSSGKVEEITFKNSKECWGYFSTSSGGEIHQFADSQFGHIFSSGETREDARRGMVMALRNLVIRGEIRTSSPYVLELLETAEFRDCNVSTSWLDDLIAKRNAEVPKQQSAHVALIAASIFRSLRTTQQNTDKYISFIVAGHVPSTEYLSNYQTESYVSYGTKYIVAAGRVNQWEYALSLNGSMVHVPFRILKSGALQLTVGGKTLVAYVEEDSNSLRITIGGRVISFTGDLDPTKVLASVPGRLVRYVIENEGHVNEGGTFAEVEVMKMILPLRASASGVLHHRAVPGSTIVMGSLLAEITPDDPSKVSRPTEIKDPWPSELLIGRKYERPDRVTRARRALQGMWDMLQGFHFQDLPVEERLRSIFEDLTSLFLSAVTLQTIRLPFLEVAEDGGQQTPTEKFRTVFGTLIAQYVQTEKLFDVSTRQEAIDRLRESCDDNIEVLRLDFAHNQSCHHLIIRHILTYLEGNHVLIKALQGSLSSLVTLKSYTYGSLLLQAQYLLRQSSQPSVTERKACFAKELEEGSLQKLIASSYGYDLLCSVMFDRQMPQLTQICLELFIQREHFGESTIDDLDIFKVGISWYASYSFAFLEDSQMFTVSSSEELESQATRGLGVCMMFYDYQVLSSTLAAAFSDVLSHLSNEVTVCTIFFAIPRENTQEEAAAVCARVLEDHHTAMEAYRILETIYFVVHGMPDGPHYFTYRRANDFKEDTLIRNVLPQAARRLELERLANFDVDMYPTPYKEVHVFKATPKKSGASQLENRLFARIGLTPHDMGLSHWTVGTEVDAGHMLDKAMAALEVARNDISMKYPVSNHIFVKMIELTFDVSTLQRLLGAAASSYQPRLVHLGVTEVELAFHAKVPTGLIPMRVICTSPSGYGMTVHVYYESVERGLVYLHRAETSEDVSLTACSLPNDFLVDLNPSVPVTPSHMARTISKLEALRQLLPTKKQVTYRAPVEDGASADTARILLGPYHTFTPVQVKRLQARVAKATYIEDWPELLNLILRKDWGMLRDSRGFKRSHVPVRPLYATRLYLGDDGKTLTMAKPNAETCGMVVWIVEYHPSSYFDMESASSDTRRFVMVGNDIAFQSGSFAVPEDVVFKAASSLARSERIPFVYISANSGARLGLCAEVKKHFLVALSPKNEIDYLYLTEADYAALTRKGVRVAVEEVITAEGEKRFAITGIVGSPSEYLGVENLRGSGLIAGEMSKNYSVIPTISIVTGRSVGIGAYLNRLGRRVIQTADSPLILTGASALNRLLGKDVYAGNNQLGGRQIMVPNGITHWNTKHDYASARTLLRWLDYVPAVTNPKRCNPRRLLTHVADPVDRDVTFTPEPNTPYDPRILITGTSDRTGLFDRGSWMESLEGWAKSVVTGRATLGGIPCGIILVETRLTKKFNPADPADPTSSASFVAQAGQVWFPDSARKTADALDDFHHERLPCFIIANWRGFSGGMRDMYDEVLKFGASIVDNLRIYTAPVFIYIPPFGELRGGAWVVVDPVINHQGVVEMYCDPTSRGGILEPAGVAEIKFRDDDVRELIRRNCPSLGRMDPKTARAEESRLLPLYRDVAVRFADLHDTHVRMKAVGVIRDVISWKDSRRTLHAKLLRKLKELELATMLVEEGTVLSMADAIERIEARYHKEHPDVRWGTDDVTQLAWLSQLSMTSFGNEMSNKRFAKLSQIRVLLRELQDENGSLENMFADIFEDPDYMHAAMTVLRYSTPETPLDNHLDRASPPC